ncbi:MAG TPA: ASPIC/UnbV domain-containing protein, partial [Opitutaceae bacterium]
TVLRNHAGGHRLIVALRGTRSNFFGIGSTIRIETASGQQTRQLWLARGYMSSSEPLLHFGLGSNEMIRRLTVTWPSGVEQIFEDLPADRRFTITEPQANEPTIDANVAAAAPLFVAASASGLSSDSPEEVVDEATEQPLLPFHQNRRGPALAVKPTSSGNSMIVIGGTTLSPFVTLTKSPDGNFRPISHAEFRTPAACDDGPLLIIPVDRSGHETLIVTKGGNVLPDDAPEYQPQVFKWDESNHWIATPEILPPVHINAGAITAADFDRDGLLDLFIGGRVSSGLYPTSPHSALLRNRDGKFEDVTDQVAPELRRVGMVTSAIWCDVDGDGWSDLLLTLDWGTVRYFHNDHGTGFSDWSDRAGFSKAGTGWWSSISSADFNGDGRPDFVVGNVGLNTQYRASPQHPAILYYGDFKGDGSTQLIEAYYEGDRLYPWRSLRELAHVIPNLRRRFPTNNQFAKATIEDILGKSRMAEAEKMTATELRSGVFLSQPDGTYQFVPLPRIAQISPMEGIVCGDFDGDGYADIYAVQNSYSPSPAVGRFDSGISQLLLGNGDGTFRPIDAAASGLVVTGDAKALVTLDIDDDGRPDFFLSRNDNTTLAFRNAAQPENHFLRVRLHGALGNESAVGAMVTTFLDDGSRQSAEVHSTSGYYSQSSGELFFGASSAKKFQRVIVRWPRGQQSEIAIPPGETKLETAEPSS